MSFKRPFAPQWGRQRTQAEIDLDRRLEEAARRLAGPAIGRDEWVRAQYRAASRGGATKAQIEQRFNHSDMQIMDAHVDQMFWQMVRHEARTNPTYNRQMEFIENFYELPQHEFLLRIKSRFWALMQQWTDDKKHRQFLQEIYRAWHAAQMQLEEPQYLARARQDAASESAYRSSANYLREEYMWLQREDPMQALFHAMDQEEE